MRYCTFLIAFALGMRFVLSFWPPAYEVNLNDRKVFVIASDDTEYDDESENEMIQAADLALFEPLTNDEEKYKPLHSHVELYNQRAARTATEFAEAFPLFQPNLEEIHELIEEAKPFVAGFKHELDKYDFDDLEERVFKAMRKKRNVSDPSAMREMTKLMAKRVTKRSDNENVIEVIENISSSTTLSYSKTRGNETRKKRQLEDQKDQVSQDVTENPKSTTEPKNSDTQGREDYSREEIADKEDYNYDLFKAEYYQQIESIKKDNKTFNYTESEEPEESAGDAVRKIVDFKIPRNCTKEELTEIGAKSLECLVYDYKHAKTKKNVSRILSRTWVVIRVWICVYLCIALPCWCQKGWCCCCFRCAFCNPMEGIETAKKYYAENPPGVLVEHSDLSRKESKTTEFEPTLFELDAYEKFEAEMRNL